jgi:hypothetical protein
MKCENCCGKGMEYYYAEISRDGTRVTIEQRERICHRCNGLGVRLETNADRIRSMTDEGLAAYLVDIGFDCHLCSEHRRLDNEPLLRNEKCDEKCEKHCLDWLKQPAEEDA